MTGDESGSIVPLQSGKTCCAAFCASLALLAGSGMNASCNRWKERRTVIRYARMSLGWFIYTWASMNSFSAFKKRRKQGSPCLLRGSLAYIFSELLIWMQYVKRVCEQNVSSHRNFLHTVGEIKGLETFFRLILSEKNRFSRQTIHQLNISDVKMLLLTGKIGKAYKVRDSFCLHDRRNFPPLFFKLGAWRAAKTRACLLRFSALKPI